MTKAGTPYFTSATFKFLRDLARNNNREWFQANKMRYAETVQQPALRLIADLAQPLKKISPHYIADPRAVGGSLFRIHRDTRFSKEKTPYKTWAGMQFFHMRRRELEGGTPVFYLHIQPGQCFIGGGHWHPQPEAVKHIRNYMVNNPASWKKATRAKCFLKHYKLDGRSLARPPRGFDPQHELIEDLKRQDFVAVASLEDAQFLSPGLPAVIIRHFQLAAPLVDWLCGALDLEF